MMAGGDNEDRPIDPDEGSPLGEPEELAFADDNERLPWLESDEDYEQEGGVDTGRIVGFALLALLALAVLVGLIWWLGKRDPDPELVPDGSTIEAPEGAYKVKPANPGGQTFEGTGDIAPAVGEGKKTEGRIATDDSVESAAGAKEDGKAGGEAAAAPVSGPGVQVGAYSSKALAEEGWASLMRQTDKLNGVRHRVIEGKVDIGTIYRLQAVPGDLAAANTLCAALKADGVACQVKR